MKKVLLAVFFIIGCLFLSSCFDEATSIGIIGGADGPTAIIVAK